MPKAKETTTDAPSFSGVALDTLPKAVKGASAASIATGTAILAQLDAGLAAVEGTVHPDRKAAVTRAAQLKRAVGAVRDVAVSHRVIAADGGFQVAILLRDAESTDADAPTDAAESTDS